MAATTELRPLRIGEVLDAAFKVYRRNAVTLWKIIALVVIPVNVLGALILLSVLPDDFFEPGFAGTTLTDSEIWAFAAAMIVLALISVVTILAATAACLKVVSDSYLGGRSTAGSSLAFATRRLHSLLWVGFLTVFFLLIIGAVAVAATVGAESIALAFLFLPVILWLWVAWSFAPPALLVEDVRGRKALGRSFKLVRGRWWAVFWTLLLGFVITSVVGFGVELILRPFIEESESLTTAVMLDAVLRSVTAVLTTPFSAALVAILYFDLRVRKEGFDVELLAQRIGTPEGVTGALPPEPPQR